ncbi:12329_t:CDS:2, partial [Ambispora gerdemannii]
EPYRGGQTAVKGAQEVFKGSPGKRSKTSQRRGALSSKEPPRHVEIMNATKLTPTETKYLRILGKKHILLPTKYKKPLVAG